MHSKHILVIGTLAALALVNGACTGVAPRTDRELGDRVREVRLRQTANPQPVRTPDQVGELDGRVARETMNVYVNSFRAPPPPMTVFNFGIGASSSQ